MQVIFQFKGQIRLFKVNKFSETQHIKKCKKGYETVTRENSPGRDRHLSFYLKAQSLHLSEINYDLLNCFCRFFVSDKGYLNSISNAAARCLPLFYKIYSHCLGSEGEKLQITRPSEIQGKFQPIYYLVLED